MGWGEGWGVVNWESENRLDFYQMFYFYVVLEKH